MLTLDLLRYRIDGDSVTPVYLTVTGGKRYVGMAEQLIELAGAHVGRTLGEFEEAIEEMLGAAPDYKVYRGLAKILNEYLLTVAASDVDAEALRQKVFVTAAEGGPYARRPDLLFTRTYTERTEEIAGELGSSAETLLASLYSDLRENQVVESFDSSITPEELIERYNTALAQAMLYRATRMIIDVKDGYRTVFKYIKLARLMHSIRPHDGGYRIELDGPVSLFSNVERYGINMARLLPAIIKCEDWRLAAKVNVGGGEKLFRLSPRTGLRSHYRDEPVFDSAPEEAFYNKFVRNSKSKWTIEREGSVLDLKDTVLIPDFKFTHKKDGRVAHLEIIGFWTPEYLAKKLDKLSRVKEANIVVAVPESLNCSKDTFSGPVVRYKQRLLIKDVLPAVEEAAKRENEER